MNGANLLVAALENEGVKQIFGVPGEENLDVVEALRRSTIELVVTRHEQVAAFMAATHGRLTGEAGVCLSTLGPGALNLTTGAAYALLGAMPMVMITGQKGVLSREPAAAVGCLVGFREAPADSFLQHADGQGRRRRRIRAVHGHRRAIGARLCP